MNEYDIGQAFYEIEKELMESMIRNMERHHLDEVKEKKDWIQWQALQLKALEAYRKQNRKKFGPKFQKINDAIDVIIEEARLTGNHNQEADILSKIKKGFTGYHKGAEGDIEGDFFRVNDRKLNALIKATKEDFQKAEHAILRMADDQYRKIIYKAQVYGTTGAGTYEKAVDMATKDMLSAGLNCVVYKNGARHRLEDWAYMAIQTASKRAYLTGEGEKRAEWGIHTVIMSKRRSACPLCAPFAGKVMIDDVWSGGTAEESKELHYPLLSKAIEAGLYHPRCRDSHSTFFEGITEEGKPWKKEELEKIAEKAKKEEQQRYWERQAEKYNRLAKLSLDSENKILYNKSANKWNGHLNRVRFRTGEDSAEEYAEHMRLSTDLSKEIKRRYGNSTSENVIDKLYSEMYNWIDKLEDDEIKYIKKYTKNPGDKSPNKLFQRLNRMLRGEDDYDSKLDYIAECISSGIKRYNIEQDIICYRKTDADYTVGRKIGDLFKFNYFLSTSVDEKGTLKGQFFYKIYVRRGAAGALIEGLSDYKNQKEFLIDKDCLYRVICRKGKKIELEVLM